MGGTNEQCPPTAEFSTETEVWALWDSFLTGVKMTYRIVSIL